MTPDHRTTGYPTLALADAYAATARYLRHREVVDRYLQAEDRVFD